MSLITTSPDGKTVINKDLLLDEREKFIPLDTSKPFKLNADTTGFCECRAHTERENVLTQQQTLRSTQRSGWSSLASKLLPRIRHFLSRTGSGLSRMRSRLQRPATLLSAVRWHSSTRFVRRKSVSSHGIVAILCSEFNDIADLVWGAIASNLATIVSTWWENPHVVNMLNAFRRASFEPL